MNAHSKVIPGAPRAVLSAPFAAATTALSDNEAEAADIDHAWKSLVIRCQAARDDFSRGIGEQCDEETETRLCYASASANIALMLFPAPNGAALLQKMDICATEECLEMIGMKDAIWQVLLADVERLFAPQETGA